MPPRILIVSILCAALAAGCAGPSLSPEQRAELERPARGLEARGAWRDAALAWQQAADAQRGDLATSLRLNAADALIEAGDGPGAVAVTRALPESLPPELALRRTLVLADAALLAGEPAAALSRVGAAVSSADPALVSRYRRIRADALELGDDPLGAARERALRDALLTSPEETYRNRLQIWELLGQVPEEQLARQPTAPPAADSGWIELASIARRSRLDLAGLEAGLADWTARYPGHPAGEQIVPALVENARAESRPPTRVALLLPQSGPFAGAAAAIQNGFMAAWFADAPNPDRPEVALYDSASGDVSATYAEALTQGAQFVVGPLSKDAVNDLITGADLSVTTLTLNYPSLDAAAPAPAPGTAAAAIDASVPAVASESAPDSEAGDGSPAGRSLQRVYHFALAPEDEARRAAEHAFSRGARQAAVLAPAGAWGERVGAAFTRRWLALGGVVAEEQLFPQEATGLSDAIERLLNLDDSEARARALRATLVRSLEHEPEPRSDLDVIFMAAYPESARQLRPLLLFHRAGDVPVIATSHVYAGRPDPGADQDIDGIVFGDMPWLLDPGSYTLPEQVERIWPASQGAAGRLYAFGADAYLLVNGLRDLRTGPAAGRLPGLTGDLAIGEDRHVMRDLQWAQIREGVPLRLDTAPGAARPWGIAFP